MAFIYSSLVVLLGLSSFSMAQAQEFKCTIRTYDGHYVTAVGGGGRITNVIHTDATRVGNWEKFRLNCR
ncbi:MAG: hypothetical protein NDI69_11100 [Bacteriovoracaceae bacterium]|nr:hypothetical protein [Bacteriovoracaceae bacterium]